MNEFQQKVTAHRLLWWSKAIKMVSRLAITECTARNYYINIHYWPQLVHFFPYCQKNQQNNHPKTHLRGQLKSYLVIILKALPTTRIRLIVDWFSTLSVFISSTVDLVFLSEQYDKIGFGVASNLQQNFVYRFRNVQ